LHSIAWAFGAANAKAPALAGRLAFGGEIHTRSQKHHTVDLQRLHSVSNVSGQGPMLPLILKGFPRPTNGLHPADSWYGVCSSFSR
jgi:hypothetical protein